MHDVCRAMSLLNRIRDCNATDLSGFLPFRVEGRRVGWVDHNFSNELKHFNDVFIVSNQEVSLHPALAGFETRTAAVADVVGQLADVGLIPGWRGEPYPVTPAFEAPSLFIVERAAAVRFGLRSYGVHLLGYVGSGPDLRLWVAQRSEDKATGPGQKDAFVGGGITYGLKPRETLIKEAWEEAGLPAALARRARPVGDVRFLYRSELGLDQGLDYQYELELPVDFRPENQDGEVASFSLLPATQVMAEIAETRAYYYDANLAFIAFFLRHGLVPPDHPDHAALLSGLRGEV